MSAPDEFGTFGTEFELGSLSQAARISEHDVIMADRYSISLEAVSNSALRVQMAHERLAEAIQKFGAGSEQAKRAQQELQLATTSLEISQQRMHDRLIFATVSVIPQVISALQALTVSELTASAAAGPVMALLAAGGMLAMVSYESMQAQQTPNVNVYGDINLQGVQSPASFATSMAQSTRP